MLLACETMLITYNLILTRMRRRCGPIRSSSNCWRSTLAMEHNLGIPPFGVNFTIYMWDCKGQLPFAGVWGHPHRRQLKHLNNRKRKRDQALPLGAWKSEPVVGVRARTSAACGRTRVEALALTPEAGGDSTSL